MVVFSQLFEHIILALLGINFFHKLRISRSEVQDFVVCSIDVLGALFNDLADNVFIDLTHLLEKIQRCIATNNVVLENIIHHSNLIVDKFVNQI